MQHQQLVRTGLGALGRRIERRQRNVVHREDHHARQRCDTTDKCSELMIGTDHFQLDRLFGVEIFRYLGTWLEQLLLQTRRQCSLRDVDQQLRHFRLARQLTQQLPQHVFHLVQLLLQRFEIDRLGLLFGELALQLLFFASQILLTCFAGR